MQANQNPKNRQQRIIQSTSCSFQNHKYGARFVRVAKPIGCTHDVKHFLAHNVMFENLKPRFSQLTQQHITSVFRNLHFGRSF